VSHTATVADTDLTENSSLTVADFSSLFGFAPEAIIEAIRRNRTSLKKAFYTIPDLALRWNCSRGTVYNILAESEFKVFTLVRKSKGKGKRQVPAAAVEKIEQQRMERLEK